MRYVPAEQLKPGMVLGQGLHDASGRMLLGKNTRLTAENIKYIIFLGTGGVYVDDEISKDIELYDVVKPEVKNGFYTENNVLVCYINGVKQSGAFTFSSGGRSHSRRSSMAAG